MSKQEMPDGSWHGISVARCDGGDYIAGMSDVSPEQLVKLESELACLERQYEQLNKVVVEQGKLLMRLQTQVQRLSQAQETQLLDQIKSNNAKPPHYQ